MPSRFWRFAEKYSEQNDVLPLVHSTTYFNFRSVIESGRLEATECDVFHEDLLYFFYGRPAYRVAPKIDCRSDSFYYPICFLIKPNSINNIKRAFPFDSGAFSNGIFDEYKHKSMSINDFLLRNDIKELSRVITAFFGNNYNYFYGEYNNNIKFNFDEMEANALYSMITTSGETKHDDRRYTIEVQTAENLDINNNVLAVVLPIAALDSPLIRDFILNKCNAVPLTYSTFKGTSPREYTGVIREIISEFLLKEGILQNV